MCERYPLASCAVNDARPLRAVRAGGMIGVEHHRRVSRSGESVC